MSEKDIYNGMSLPEQVELAEKIKLLWGFLYSLKDHRDVIDNLAKDASSRASIAVSAAVLNPMGYEQAEAKHKRVARRAELLVEMFDVLESTDTDVLDAEKREKGMQDIAKIFG